MPEPLLFFDLPFDDGGALERIAQVMMFFRLSRFFKELLWKNAVPLHGKPFATRSEEIAEAPEANNEPIDETENPELGEVIEGYDGEVDWRPREPVDIGVPGKSKLNQGRFLNNLIANAASFGFSLLIGVWYTPYLLHHLGTAAYGIVPLISQLTGYMTILVVTLKFDHGPLYDDRTGT